MRIETTPVAGVAIVRIDPRTDERGFFARSFDRDAFAEAGLETELVQANISWNERRGTLRGMHYQLESAPEAKLVRCTRGAVLDQVVDVRPGSPTYLQHVSVELTEDNRTALYVPPLFAHGFITLADRTEVTYNVSAPYTPGVERGLRHDDPDLGLSWPVPVEVVSAKDASWPLLADVGGEAPR
ncbi:dTDP-4-dehydrorhamnose 3,5-epimerase [Quadrisphaera sp. DSM 44207]|uniref:dTDP-4-dehydrorhamnose 3,5-epimerase n=1 Tax=Quadrisphaera sp. DSM 44207 TaxID=1881057 RepID=UPI00088C2EF1|nr:dTDP-4-dehydrorhamnose 3,5-epimerase [Quadrisphaera sp. DSM 44207]SDQ68680.1 dTDP-4-dehydrorhamnose 3,5-epimerase [Quadrisphaera sp. DSM 44207]